ncbi:MAG: benzoyl-CoA reductase, bzd-type, subunit Q [Planctomycetota bacterium]|nr:benzoyl-CoA reductase, bzd-type, subunit Q [Planctomycetota bacterium]
MAVEYWRWPERKWVSKEIDWKKAKTITAGVDVGSVSSKALVLVDDQIFSYSLTRTGSDSPQSADKALSLALGESDLPREKIQYIIGTGYGRINIPFAQRAITEIACHARGANYIFGSKTRTVLDMGGQDCKAIKCDEKGKVTAFLMNDKCAAGTGRGMEVFADLLQVPIQDIGDMSFDIEEEPDPVSSTCVVFAKSEALGLLKKGWPKAKVLAAYCAAMAHRVFTLLERVGVEKEFVITGGIAKNKGVVKRLEKELGFSALPMPEDAKFDPQLAGALGAALFARAIIEKGKA